MYYNIPDDRCKYKVLKDVVINIKLYNSWKYYRLFLNANGLSKNKYTWSDYYKDLFAQTITHVDLLIPAGSIFYLAPIMKKVYIRFYRKDNKVKELITGGQIILEKNQFATIDCEPYNA